MPSLKSVGTAITILLCLVMAVVTTSHLEASGTWSPTGSMSTTRGLHTATLLPDGRVLVTGGYSGDVGGGSSAELYDPMLGTWSPMAAMSTARSRHTATLLPDGRVLVTGGSGSYVGSAELYDPRLGTWSPTAAMSTARSHHTATLLTDGRVLVSGGSPDGTYAWGSAEIYDPALGTWSSTPPMSTARSGHTATLLQDGRVLVNGGGSYASNTSASAEIYDPALGTWSQTGSMTAEREVHTATLLLDGRVLVSGGFANYYYDDGEGGIHYSAAQWASAEIYDPVSETWWETGSMRSWEPGSMYAGTRSYHMSTLLSDGRVLVSGGYAYYYPAHYLASAEIYDPAHGTWSPAAVMSTPRIGHTATLLQDGRVLVSGNGGFALNTIWASAEIYSPGEPDATPPELSCAAADGAWHNSDVTIACTASDLESGLANAADASFNLTTDVPVGTETASAATNSRQVCNVEGNCSTAAPITGNKVDKKAPTIAIALPMAGATYGLQSKIGASYACSDGGSGMRSCTGPVANGSVVNTSSKGTKTFAVTAVDTVGNSSTVSVTYSVVAGRK
jgi:hypothetical protein